MYSPCPCAYPAIMTPTLLHLHRRQPTLVALEWVLFTVFAMDVALKTYVREARIAYLTSFDGLAGVASIVSILQLRGQASFGFLRVLRLYRLAKMVGHGVVVYQVCCLVCAVGEQTLIKMSVVPLLNKGHLHIAMLRCRTRRWWTIGTLLLLLWRRARGARSPASSPSC